MKLDLPVYKFVIDDTEESGVKTISLVDDPAIQSFFVAFDNQKPKPKYFKSSQYEQVVMGIALQPDLPIYRIDQNTGEEYYGVFTADVIKQIVLKFHKQLQSNNVNLMHGENTYIDAYMFNDYIVDTQAQIDDLKTKGIVDAKLGSWVVSYKIEDPEVFQMVIDGNFKAFSVEAYLDTMMFSRVKNKFENKINKEMKKYNKTLKDKIMAIFADFQVFERALVPELAFEIEWGEVGQPVNKVVVDENGTETLTPVGQGEFATDMGIVVVDESSNLVEVRELPAQPEVEEPEVEEPEVEEPEVSPEAQVTGTTGQTGTTTTEMADYPWDTCISDQLAAGYSQDSAEKICGYIKEKNMTADQLTPDELKELGVEAPVPVVPKRGIEKSVLELVGTNDGEYTILVKVENGVVVDAVSQTMHDLMFEKDKEIQTLKDENKVLMEKVNEPITDPILQPEVQKPDFSKMSTYEKLMYSKGLKPFDK